MIKHPNKNTYEFLHRRNSLPFDPLQASYDALYYKDFAWLSPKTWFKRRNYNEILSILSAQFGISRDTIHYRLMEMIGYVDWDENT